MGWKTGDFVNAWVAGTLGRKKTHSVFRVMKGDHCEIMVKSEKSNGVTVGTSIVGLKMAAVNPTGAELELLLYHSMAANNFGYGLTRELDLYMAPSLPFEVMDDQDSNILNSGIISWTNDKVLIEIGDKPYLLTFKKDNHENPVYWISPTNHRFHKFSTCEVVNTRVATVADALVALDIPDDLVDVMGLYYAKPMPDTFELPPLTTAKDDLQQGMNPLDFGFKDWECDIVTRDYKSDILALTPTSYALDYKSDPRVVEWNLAKQRRDAAANKLKESLPETYGNLTIRIGRYNSDEGPGVIVRTTQGVFIKGIMHNNKRWGDKFHAKVWHKIDRPSFTITLD